METKMVLKVETVDSVLCVTHVYHPVKDKFIDVNDFSESMDSYNSLLSLLKDNKLITFVVNYEKITTVDMEAVNIITPLFKETNSSVMYFAYIDLEKKTIYNSNCPV